MDRKDLLSLVQKAKKLEQQLSLDGPQTDEELWFWIRDKLGIELTKESVCEGHCSPFEFLADIYFEKVESALLIANRAGGKCVEENSLVTDPDTGRVVTIKEAYEDIKFKKIFTLNNNSLESINIAQKWDTGKSKTKKIILNSGREIIITYEHPLLTAFGWKRADELKVGDCVGEPIKIKCPQNPIEIPNSHVDLLALVLSEGNYSGRYVGFSTADQEIVKIAKDIANDFIGIYIKYIDNYDYKFTKKNGFGKYNSVRQKLYDYGINHETAPNKKIPECIFRLGEKQLSRFLSIYWMCDGTVCGGKEVSICSSSKQIVDDIQHLLLRLGIQSRVKKNHPNAWDVIIYNQFLEIFNIKIKLWGYKKNRLNKILSKKRNYNLGRPPITQEFIDGVRDKLNERTWHEKRRQPTHKVRDYLGWDDGARIGGPSVLTCGGVKTISQKRLESLCLFSGLEEKKYEVLLNKNLWWDSIVSIEDNGICNTYDFTIDNTHCFLANDIINHNTHNAGIFNLLNSLYKPSCESIIIGAIEPQAKRAYSHFQNFTKDINTGKLIPEIKSIRVTETEFKNGSKLEIIAGTPAATNGPHSQKVLFDEAELADPLAWEESRAISTSKELPNGNVIKAQDIITSTRKRGKGLMQQLVDEVERAKAKGLRPPYELYKYCIFECVEQQKNCQIANPDLPEEKRCSCDKVVKGNWDDEDRRPRTLKDICKGKFYKSRGWKPLDDVINTFMQSSRSVWEAQQECSKPETEHMIIPGFSREIHGLLDWVPDPKLGPIYMGFDAGGTHPHAVVWYQATRYEIEVNSFNGNPIRVKEGSRVAFDEIYIAEVGNNKVADLIVEKEKKYKKIWKGWNTSYRFIDPQAKAARLDLEHHIPPLKFSWFATREFEEHVKILKELFEDHLFYIDVPSCEMLTDELEDWRRNPNTGKEIDFKNHACAATRYCLSNVAIIERDIGKFKGIPLSTAREPFHRDYDSDPFTPVSAENNPDIPESERWRFSFDHRGS